MPNRITAIWTSGGAHNTHEHIEEVRYVEDGTRIVHQQTIDQVISAIDRNMRYYVFRYGRSIPVTIGTKDSVRYIGTEPDNTLINNLLSLPLF